MGDRIIIETDLGETLETKVMKETGDCHIIGKLMVKIEGTILASVTVHEGQVQG